MFFEYYCLKNHINAVIFYDIYIYLQNKKHICILESETLIDPIDMIIEYNAITYIEIFCNKNYTYIVAVKQKYPCTLDSKELSDNINDIAGNYNETATITLF
jgi:hypothetical protein